MWKLRFSPVSFSGKDFWEQDSATLLKTIFFKDFDWIFPLATFRTVVYKNIFFPRHFCDCFRTLHSSTRLLFLLFLISPICCFVVFTPFIKFNFHNGWFEGLCIFLMHILKIVGILFLKCELVRTLYLVGLLSDL